MRIIEGLKDFPLELPYPVLTIGNFDGVHVGHKRLLGQTAEIARRNAGTSIAMTFWPHPAVFFAPHRRLQYLTEPSVKCALMEEAGIDVTLIVSFNRDFARIEPEGFVRDILVGTLRAREIVVGFNFRFGKDKAGDARFLEEEASRLGCRTHVIGPFYIGAEVISSSRIRSLLREGEVEKAARLLGREYGVQGEVVHGGHRGAGLGFPTANVRPGNLILPARGVYVARIVVEGEVHPGVVNVGVNPTFGGDALSVEAHLFDFNRDLYGARIEVRFCRRLRDERKFSSVEELVDQIRRDVEAARGFFQEEAGDAP